MGKNLPILAELNISSVFKKTAKGSVDVFSFFIFFFERISNCVNQLEGVFSHEAAEELWSTINFRTWSNPKLAPRLPRRCVASRAARPSKWAKDQSRDRPTDRPLTVLIVLSDELYLTRHRRSKGLIRKEKKEWPCSRGYNSLKGLKAGHLYQFGSKKEKLSLVAWQTKLTSHTNLFYKRFNV